MNAGTTDVLRWLSALTFALAIGALVGCDETDCEERCVEDVADWYEDCEECGDGVLFESECAEIWCE